MCILSEILWVRSIISNTIQIEIQLLHFPHSFIFSWAPYEVVDEFPKKYWYSSTWYFWKLFFRRVSCRTFIFHLFKWLYLNGSPLDFEHWERFWWVATNLERWRAIINKTNIDVCKKYICVCEKLREWDPWRIQVEELSFEWNFGLRWHWAASKNSLITFVLC